MRRSMIALLLAAGTPSMLMAEPIPTRAPVPAPVPAAAPVPVGAVVQVNTGRGRLVTLPRPMTDLFIADDGIADVQVRSPTQLYIFGKKTGETTVSATAKGGQVVFTTTVRVGNNLGSVGDMLALTMPDAKIVATPMNGMMLLTGTVAAPADAAEAERLVQLFVGEGTKVLSRLRTATPMQVNLQVRFAEVSRGFSKNIGVNLTSRDAGRSGLLFGIGQGRQGTISTVPGIPGLPNAPVDTNGAQPGDTLYTFPSNGALGTTLGLAGSLLGMNLLAAIDLGENLGQVTTLANPNLTALSGETGSFLAGGEIPIPIAQGFGTVSVEFKQYGISLGYTPTVLADGRISLHVKPEVSQLDYSNAIAMNGTRVPGITSRRAETTVELGSGESLMIAGLLQNTRNNSVDKAPILSDLPILGALFRSNAWRRNETELVIIITPYLVKPMNSPAQVALPTDGDRAPTDVERVFLGKLSSGKTGEKRPVPTMAPAVPPATSPALPR